MEKLNIQNIYKNGFTDNCYLELATNIVTEIIDTRKLEYYIQSVIKLNNPKTRFKTY